MTHDRNTISWRTSKQLFLVTSLIYLLGDEAVSASDDITNIWYYGCRWFGGTANLLSCNCLPDAQEMYIQRHSIPGYDTSAIEINGCPQVRFGANSVADLRNLRRIQVTNVPSLIFEPNSISWVGYRDPSVTQEERFDLSIPSLKILIKNSTVTSIGSHSFSGRINEIHFQDDRIENIEAYAFSNLLQMENLLFTNVLLRDVKPQAFKKFGTEFVTLDWVTAEYLPSRTLAEVTVYRSFVIRNCKFDTLRPGTFIVNNPDTFTVINNEVKQLEGEAFLVTTTGDVVFRDNTFHNVQNHAFKGINLDSTRVSTKRTITFDGNTFGPLDGHSLDVQPQFEARVTNLNINQTCECESIVKTLKDSDFYNEISCMDLDGQYVTVKDFKSANCSVLSGYYTIVIVVCVLILVISLVVIAFYVYYVMVYKRQKYGCGKGAKKAPMSLIVPDGRTYKETELHVIVEKADLLTTDL